MSVIANRCNSPYGDTHTCMNCLKKSHSLFNDLNIEELEILDRNRYNVSYKAGEIICKEGAKSAGLICLNIGKVKMCKSSANGVEQILALKKPVEFIGFSTLMNGDNYLTSAIALEDSNVCVIEKSDFIQIASNSGPFAIKILKFLANELNEMDNRMVNLIHKHVKARMADALILLSDVYGTEENGCLSVSLKRQDLAALSKMTVSNASRTLTTFSKENIIEVSRRDIRIIDIKKLQEISDFS